MPQPFWPKAPWAMRALAASRRAARADARPAYPSIFEVLAEHRPAGKPTSEKREAARPGELPVADIVQQLGRARSAGLGR